MFLSRARLRGSLIRGSSGKLHSRANILLDYQVTMLICEAFEDIVQTMADPQSYQALCEKVLPSLNGAFDVASVTSDDPLVIVSASISCI